MNLSEKKAAAKAALVAAEAKATVAIKSKALEELVSKKTELTYNGFAFYKGKTGSGNWRYTFVDPSDNTGFNFYAKEDLGAEVNIKDVQFGVQVMPDGSELLWWN